MAIKRRAIKQLQKALTGAVSLPFGETPQYVDNDGYEVDAATFAELEGLGGVADGSGDVSAPEIDETGEGVEIEAEEEDEIGEILADEAMDVDGEEVEVEGDGGGEAEGEGEEDVEEAHPLLSIMDSLVLPYSLSITRQYHIQKLLPRIFSHPPIPSYNKPRPRAPPKGTFVFPTPAPYLPLPMREYHAPRPSYPPSRVSDTATPPPASSSSLAPIKAPLPDRTEPINSEAHAPSAQQLEGGVSIGKGKKKEKGKARDRQAGNEQENEPPAHEIDCIGRVTLSIGPISYPGTEVWIGRFVESRTPVIKPPKRVARAERRPGEYVWRPNLTGKRLRQEGSAPGRPPVGPGYPAGGAGPSGSHASPFRPYSYPPPRPPPVRPPRSEIAPSLIQMVNEAATRNPWLSVIIHKAARNMASKDELAKLGRVVNKLKEGTFVGSEEDEAPSAASAGPGAQNANGGPSGSGRPPSSITQPYRPPTSGPSSSSSSIYRPPINPAPPHAPMPVRDESTSPLTNIDDDSDSDVDMTGPPQVGGGPMDGVEPPAHASPSSHQAEFQRASSSTMEPGVAAQSSASSVQATAPLAAPSYTPPIDPNMPISTAVPPPSASLNDARAESHGPGIPSPFHISPRPPNPPLGSPASFSISPGVQPSPPPPPPPRIVYPQPPPFLLVAFQEAPTEKFLIPMGMDSFISRVGDKPDTPTKDIPPQPIDVKPGIQTGDPSTEPIKDEGVATIPVISSITTDTTLLPGGKRTRASLGRNAKIHEVATPTPIAPPTPVKEPTPPVEPEITVKSQDEKVSKPASGLPPLPGMTPADGTVLVSTFLPVDGWQSPNWAELAKTLAWHPDYTPPPPPPPPPLEPAPQAVKVEIEPAAMAEPDSVKGPATPGAGVRSLRQTSKSVSSGQIPQRPQPQPKPKPTLLNLGAESLLPTSDTPLHAVTIRLEGVSDNIWLRLKAVLMAVENVQIDSLQPLLEAELPAKPIDAADANLTSTTSSTPNVAVAPTSSTNTAVPETRASPASSTLPPTPVPPAAPAGTLHSPAAVFFARVDRLRPAYVAHKRSRFAKLLERVPPRRFLHARLSSPSAELIEASTDKWAPRPYPMSTKPLYTRDEYGEDAQGQAQETLLLSPDLEVGKRKKGEESAVTFEMPVSLDQLDDLVAENAMKGRGGGGKKGAVVDDSGKKRHGKRWKVGTICEGCGKEGLKVWRRGPGGKGTLCKSCGDMYTEGTLGPLAAPGAASVNADKQTDTAGEDTAEPVANGGGATVKMEAGVEAMTHPTESSGDRATVVEATATPAPASSVEPVVEAEAEVFTEGPSALQETPSSGINAPLQDDVSSSQHQTRDPRRAR